MKLGRQLLTIAFFVLTVQTTWASPWVTVYYGGWWTHRNAGALKPDQIDYSAFTHIIYFALTPHPDGSVGLKENFVDSPEGRQVTQLAHRAGKKVLISVGGLPEAATKADFAFFRATGLKHLDDFAENLVKVVEYFDYDGVDIDWEPLKIAEADHYIHLIHILRKKLSDLTQKTNREYLLTAAAIDLPEVFAKIQDEMDQINLMTYDMSGAWLDQTWHNSPLYSPKGSDLGSIDEIIKQFETAGVRPKKMAVGIDFYGYEWASATEKISKPRQKWHDKKPEIDAGVSYTDIVNKFMPTSKIKWDSMARVPYLSHAAKDGESFFLTYDDPTSCRAKIDYAKKKKLGGVMAWELGGQWLPNAEIKDPLLQSLKHF